MQRANQTVSKSSLGNLDLAGYADMRTNYLDAVINNINDGIYLLFLHTFRAYT